MTIAAFGARSRNGAIASSPLIPGNSTSSKSTCGGSSFGNAVSASSHAVKRCAQ
jgi:hypothetical protein